MTLHFPASEFFESQGGAAYRLTEGIRDGVGQFACSLWANYPAWLTQNKSLGSSYARGFMTELCYGQGPTPTFEPSPFTGGQCVGVQYEVLVEGDRYFNNGANQPKSSRLVVYGPIDSVFVGYNAPNFPPSSLILQCEAHDINGNPQVFTDVWGGAGWTGMITSIVINRLDGLADDCGDLGGGYPPGDPTSSDLQTTINIDLSDNSTWTSNLTYNQLAPTFNFPMGFRINGINAVLDLSGLTIYGGDTYNIPESGNNYSPPGGSGGDDGVGGGDNSIYPVQDYPVLPAFTQPKLVSTEIERLVCGEEGIETIVDTLSLVKGLAPYAQIVMLALNYLVQTKCEEEDTMSLGFPEYYTTLPGADRPAIVYLYKELDSGNWGASTYSATVHRPTQAAIDEIDTLVPPPKSLGTFVASLKLNDGARVRTSGTDSGVAVTNLNFLISRVETTQIPLNFADCITVTQNLKIQEKNVYLRAIEYYPDGAGANKSPAIRKFIHADEY